MLASFDVRRILLLVSFAVVAVTPGVARAQIPISTVTGDALDQQAVNYSNAFGIGALSLVWRQLGPSLSDPVTIKWSVFSAASALNDIVPVDGTTIAAPAGQPDQLCLARTGSLGCPPGGFCPSAVVAYLEDVGASQNEVRVRRFGDASGEWNVAARASAAQSTDLRIASDGGAGAIVSWLDVSGDTTRPRVQRLGGDGTRQWGPEGIPVATGVTTDWLRLAGDGNGGAYLVWQDPRFVNEAAIFAMHLDGSGAPVAGWPADGLLIRRGPNNPVNPDILSDGAGGAYLMWLEYEATSAGLGLQPRMIRIHADGSRFTGWLADGNPVAPLPDSPVYTWDLEPDGAGGVLVACTHFTPGGESRAMVQRLNGDGSRPAGWPATGLEGSSAPGGENQPVVVGQSGAAVLVWSDERSGDDDVYGARFLASGTRASGWPADGLPIAVGPSHQRLPLVGTGAIDNVLVVWTDVRPANESGWDLYGEVLTDDGHVVSVPTRLGGGPAFAITSPNPSRGAVRGEFTLAAAGHVQLEVHDVAGRCVARLIERDAEAGRNAFAWDARDASGSAVPAGVYFLHLRSQAGSHSRAVVIAR